MNSTILLATVSTDDYAFGVAHIEAGFSVNTFDLEAEEFMNDIIPIHIFATEAAAFEYAVNEAATI